MRKVYKATLCVVVILLLGFFSQQETKAGEANERHYSRAYSVLSANVGNSSDIRGLVQAELVKLQPNSDEEKRVMSEIKDLKPDILILIEAYNYIQARYICSSTGESYSIHGGPPLDFTVHDGPYDFVCVKNEIIAKEQDIKEDQMPEDGSYEKYKGNSVGYVDVGLKGEEGRKVRLFYVHFPSYQGVWTPAKHKIHRDAFDWISRNLSVPIPCLIAGDLNNDFTRGKSQIDNEAAFITNPLLAKKYREEQEKTHSSLYIEKQVNDLKLWIFNPLAQPLQLQFLDGSTKHGYEATWRIPPEIVWKTTIDWVMGKFCVPPFLAPGGPKTDLVSGKSGTIRTNFVTSPPDWWKDKSVVDTSRFTFDHKPLYGKVVFFWEGGKSEPPADHKADISGIYVSEDSKSRKTLELRKDNTYLMMGPLGKWEIVKTGYSSYTLLIGRDRKRTIVDEDEYEILKPLLEPLGIEDLIGFLGAAVGTLEEEAIIFYWEKGELVKEKGAEVVKGSQGRLWNRYAYTKPGQKVGGLLEFKEDNVASWGLFGKWEIKDNAIKLQSVGGIEEDSEDLPNFLEGEIKGNAITIKLSRFGKVLLFRK